MGPKKKKDGPKGKNKNISEKKAHVKPPLAEDNRKEVVKVEVKTVVDQKVPEKSSNTSVVKPAEINVEIPKYAKRRIESNWKRYEIADEDETADYSETKSIQNILQSKHGGVGSQFRFSDEKEWEEKNFTEDSLSEFYAIDLRDLATSLSCIPLNERLDIEDKYFDSEMLLRMETEAQNNFSSYKIAENPRLDVTVRLQPLQVAEKTKLEVKNLRGEEKFKDLPLPPPTKANAVCDLPTESIDELELELDSLLNLDKPSERFTSDNEDFPVVCFDDIT